MRNVRKEPKVAEIGELRDLVTPDAEADRSKNLRRRNLSVPVSVPKWQNQNPRQPSKLPDP